MPTWEIMGPSFDAANETLRSVRVVSPVDRARSKTAAHRVRVGSRHGEFVSWLGTGWDQANNGLVQGEPRSVLDAKRKGMALREGRTLVVEVRKTGSPATLVGMVVEFIFDKKRIATDRGSGELTEVGTLLQRNRVTERRSLVPLTDQTPAEDLTDHTTSAAYSDRDSTGGTITSATFVDGSVSITVTVTSGKTVYVVVTATASVYSSTASVTRCFAAIGDGTTDHNDTEVVAGQNVNHSVACVYAGTITADTTFTLRLRKDSPSANAVVEDQTIVALAVEVDA